MNTLWSVAIHRSVDARHSVRPADPETRLCTAWCWTGRTESGGTVRSDGPNTGSVKSPAPAVSDVSRRAPHTAIPPMSMSPQRFGDSRLGEGVLAVWQAVTDSIPVSRTTSELRLCTFASACHKHAPSPDTGVCWGL